LVQEQINDNRSQEKLNTSCPLRARQKVTSINSFKPGWPILASETFWGC
jgi:hypothetical protein